MPNSFHRVSRALGADHGGISTLALLVATGLLAGWMAWAVESRVTRYEVSDSARLEVDRAAYPIQTGSSGRLVLSNLVLGKEVRAGDLLVELDSTAERLSLQQERTRLGAFQPQLIALQAQMASEDQGRTAERGVLAFSIDGARAQYREAEEQASAAEQQADRAQRLHAEGILSQADAERAKADALSKRAAADHLKIAIARLEPELNVREQDREVRKKQIASDIAELEAGIANSTAAIERLQYEIERHRIRAPISGRLGECAPLRPGAHVNEGQQLGVILPSGNVQVIAEFQPAAALGKLHAGQRAAVRLDGFPWAQYGTIPAEVSRVADEIRDGKVRVELALTAASRSPIPLQHGLPGSVEVEVERVSPAQLLLRSAGAMVGAH
jgi:membrane fusion protein, adhesin transport system